MKTLCIALLLALGCKPMANYAANIAPLAISGSRKSDGTANASGKVWFYQLGTSTSVNVYSDAAATQVVTQPITLDTGGRIPAANYPDGVFITQPVRLLIQDSATPATTVSDSDYIPSTAGATGLSNAGFTDATIDGAMTKAFTSFGGQDFKFKASSGATARIVKSKLLDIGYSPIDFGAVGDGVAVDTTAVQAAINAAIADGGGVVDLGSYHYKIDQALTMTSATGIMVRGAGMAATTITSTSGTANVFTVSTGTSLKFEGFNVLNSATSTGYAFSLATVTGCAFTDVGTDGIVGTGDHARAINATSSSYISTQDCRLFTDGGFAISLTDTSNCTFVGGTVDAIGYNFTGTTGNITVVGVRGTFGHTYAADLTGTDFIFVGTNNNVATINTVVGPEIRRIGKSDGAAVTVATGATVTPSLWQFGTTLHIGVTSGGAGNVTLNAPTPTPGSVYGLRMTLVLRNAAGGNITWVPAATYVHVGGAVPAGVDGTTNVMEYLWDPVTSEWREIARSTTTT